LELLTVVSTPLRRAYDLVLARDLFIHLRNRDVRRALGNFAQSGSRFLLASSTDVRSNAELPGGEYTDHEAGHDVNLQLPPIGLPPPICSAFQYQEGGENGHPLEPAVWLGLWDLQATTFAQIRAVHDSRVT